MKNKSKIFSCISICGIFAFVFALLGQNFGFSFGAHALINGGELINDRIIFDGTGKSPTDAGNKIYLSETSTKRGTTIYLANKSAIKPTSGNVAAIRSMYETDKTFSEISFLDINNDKAENFYFQNIHSITLVADRNISSLQLDVYTAEIGQEFTKSGQINVDEQSSDTGTFDFNNIEDFAIKIKQASEPLHNTFIKQVILDYTCDTDYVPGEKHSVFAVEMTGGSIDLGSYPRYKSGDTVNFTVNPDDGFDIGTVSTSPNVSLSRTGNQYTFTMPNEDVTITATFSKIPYSLTPDPLVENGEIIIDASTYYVNDNVEFSLNPDAGYCVESYSTTPSCAITEDGGVYSFTMPVSNVEIHATFKVIPIPTYSLSVAPTVNGSNDCQAGNYHAGDEISFSVSPSSGYEIVRVYYSDGVDETDIYDDSGSYSFEMPNKNVTVYSTFKKIGSLLSGTYKYTNSMAGTFSIIFDSNSASGVQTLTNSTATIHFDYVWDTLNNSVTFTMRVEAGDNVENLGNYGLFKSGNVPVRETAISTDNNTISYMDGSFSRTYTKQ